MPKSAADKAVKVSVRLGKACRETEHAIVSEGNCRMADFTPSDIDSKVEFKKRLAFDTDSQTFQSTTC